MGLANTPYGFFSGFIMTSVPILLRAQNISVEQIAFIVTLAASPMFWVFLASPILDVRFTRRFYSILFAAIATVSLLLAVLLLRDIAILTACLVVGYAAICLYNYAFQSWMTEFMEEHHYAAVGASNNISNLGTAGVFGGLSVLAVRMLPVPYDAVVLTILFLSPFILIYFFPAATRPKRDSREVFRTFFGDLYALCRRQTCRYGLLVFVVPVCSFALPFAAVGVEFNASEKWSTLLNGPAASVVCSLGCLFAILACRRISPRMIYVLTGLVGAAVTGAMMVAPRILLVFILGRLLYSFFQGMCYTAFSSVLYGIVGRNNVLAGTQLALLSAASNLPVSYMTALDGVGFAHAGIQGMLATDTFVTIAACVPILIFFGRVKRLGLEVQEPISVLKDMAI